MDDLTQAFKDLAQRIISEVNKDKAAGKLSEREEPCKKLVVQELSYRLDGVGLMSSEVEVLRKVPYWIGGFGPEPLKWPESVAASDLLVHECEKDRPEADGRVQVFISRVAQHVLQGRAKKDATTLAISAVHDLKQTPVTWSITAWIEALYLEEKSFEPQEGFLLRRPTKEDFEQEMPVSEFESSRASLLPSAILQTTYEAASPQDAEAELERILNVLRLFKLASTRRTRVWLEPDSILYQGRRSSGGWGIEKTFTSAVSHDDLPALSTALETLRPLVPSLPYLREAGAPPVRIALQRYREAILDPITGDSVLTKGITALEALYLKSSERSELSHRLAQRAAKFLFMLGRPNPKQTYRIIKKAYNLRSSYVHGGQSGPEHQPEVHQLCREILEMTRCSLVSFFQLRPELNKNELIDRLDDAMLDEDVAEELSQQLIVDYNPC